jgi:hypothetical protein
LKNHHNHKGDNRSKENPIATATIWENQAADAPTSQNKSVLGTHPFGEIIAERTVTIGDADGCSIFAPPATTVYIANKR